MKLFLRNLPEHFAFNSVYALFPFQTPSSMEKLLKQQGIDSKYSFEKPVKARPWKPITVAKEAVEALRDYNSYGVPYLFKIENLSKVSAFPSSV